MGTTYLTATLPLTTSGTCQPLLSHATDALLGDSRSGPSISWWSKDPGPNPHCTPGGSLRQMSRIHLSDPSSLHRLSQLSFPFPELQLTPTRSQPPLFNDSQNFTQSLCDHRENLNAEVVRSTAPNSTPLETFSTTRDAKRNARRDEFIALHKEVRDVETEYTNKFSILQVFWLGKFTYRPQAGRHLFRIFFTFEVK